MTARSGFCPSRFARICSDAWLTASVKEAESETAELHRNVRISSPARIRNAARPVLEEFYRRLRPDLPAVQSRIALQGRQHRGSRSDSFVYVFVRVR